MSAGIYTTKWFLQCFIGQVRLPREAGSPRCPLLPRLLMPGEGPAPPLDMPDPS